MQPDKIELVCPAGSLPALKTAVDNGADCVYMGFRDDTNARNFTGLNFGFDNAKKCAAFFTMATRQFGILSWRRWAVCRHREVSPYMAKVG